MLAEIQAKMATIVGDIWTSKNMVGLWPYPLVAYGPYRTRTRGNDYRLFSSLLLPGDILLTTQDKYKGSNSAIPGTFKHLMVYTGTVFGHYNGESIVDPLSYGVSYKVDTDEYFPNRFRRTITHAESEGVKTQDLLDVFSHYDELVVIRPWTTALQQEAIVKTALGNVGKKYDFIFNSDCDESLYCTELGTISLKAAGIEIPDPVMKMTKIWKPWKKDRVYVADFFVEKYPVVCKTMSCNTPSFYKGPLSKVLRQKLSSCIDATKSSRDFQWVK